MSEWVWKSVGFGALVVLATALWLPREPEVLFGGSLCLLALVVCLLMLEEK